MTITLIHKENQMYHHYIIAAFGFAVLCYMIAAADDRQERAGIIGASIIMFAVSLQMFAGMLTTDDTYQQYKKDTKKIEQCEKDLPRSQKCVLIAVPNKE